MTTSTSNFLILVSFTLYNFVYHCCTYNKCYLCIFFSPIPVHLPVCRFYKAVAHLSPCSPGTHFTKSLSWSWSKFCKIYVAISWKNNCQIMSQMCTCYDSWAVVACATLRRDWVIKIQIIAKRMITRFELCAQKLIEKWIPGVRNF